MTETPDSELQLRLRIVLRDRDPVGNPDDFAELVAALLAFRTVGGDMDRCLAERFNCGTAFVHHVANGLIAPTPAFRRDAVKKLRALAAELGVKED